MCSSPSASTGSAPAVKATTAVMPKSHCFIVRLPFLQPRLRSLSLAPLGDPERDQDEQDRDAQQDGADGVDLGGHWPADHRPDVKRQGGLAWACHQLGDGEIVKRDD